MTQRRIGFGVQTPIEGATFEALARHWKAAESLGYDAAWLDDHFYGVVTPPSDDSLECWTLMAALARETTTLRLGTLVGCNGYRPPSLVAKMASSLDHISGGRLEFGIGAGWYEQEFVAYGYEFPAIRTRLAQLEEALEIFRRMWTEDRATFEGRHYAVRNVWCNPKPVQKPHPPIMIGGGGEKVLLRLVARFADRWNFGGTVDDFRHKVAVLEAHCRDVGRDPAAIEKTWFGNVLIEPDEQRLQTRLEKRKARGGFTVEMDKSGLIGTPEQIITRVREYAAVGVTHFIGMFGRVERLEATELFGRRVIPAFR